MLLAVLAVCSQEELEEALSSASDDDETRTRAEDEAKQARREQIKNKIMAVGRMQRVCQILRFAPSLPHTTSKHS
jgi:serine/threonine-protein phosphatase 2B catalytic subunit